MKKQEIEKEIKIKISTLVYSLLVLFAIAIGILSVLAYGTSTKVGVKISDKISKTIPFPAAIVDWNHIVLMKDVKTNLASIEKFYKTQNFASEGLRVDFTTDEGKKRLKIKEREIFDKMVEDQIIEILAKKQQITITDSDVQKIINQKLNEFGTIDEVKTDLANSYGWNMEDFKKRIVLPSLYAEALAQKVSVEKSDNSSAKEKINIAKKELENGKDFAQIARMYSEGSSKDTGGELGWVKKDQVLPELQEKLFGKNPFEKNDIIESSIGFHIFEIQNSKKENNMDLLQLRQIFVSKNTFADWLISEKKKMKVMVPSSSFVWNVSTGTIDFQDENMRKFEKEQRVTAVGDASIMF